MANLQTPAPNTPSPEVQARIRALEEYFAVQPTPKPVVSTIQRIDPGSGASVQSIEIAGGTMVHSNPVWIGIGVLTALAALYLAVRRLFRRRA